MLNQNENDENEQGKNAEAVRRYSGSSQRSRLSSSESLNKETNQSDENQDEFDGNGELVKELEASSKGKIKGSMLLNYLGSSNMPYSLIFMYALFLLT